MAQARAGLSTTRFLGARAGWSAAALLPLAFLALFFAWPVLAIISLGLREGGVGGRRRLLLRDGGEQRGLEAELRRAARRGESQKRLGRVRRISP